MKKRISFLVFVLALIALFAVSVLAQETVIEADDVSDITGAISSAQENDIINVKLISDIEFNTTIEIAKAVTVNVTFNGYQMSYTGTAGKNTTTAGFKLNNVGAALNLKGSNRLVSHSSYTHYGDDVKADMVGTGNLISVSYGTLNIDDAYLFATNNTFVIFGDFIDVAEYEVTVNSSVLRVNENADASAITYEGGNGYSQSLVKRILRLNNSVEYGGFYGINYNFNLTIGSEFNNVKFYDFYIKNDCWYDPQKESIRSLLMIDVDEALPVTNCVFNTYNGENGSGNVKIYTETAKQNLALYNCEFNEFEPGTKFVGDKGGAACVFIIKTYPTCSTTGLMDSYEAPQGSSSYTLYTDKVIEAVDHKLGNEIIYYPNGYTNLGVGKQICEFCQGEELTGNTFTPIFENLGYSISYTGDSVALGTKLNVEARDAFLASNPDIVFDYGIFAGNTNVNIYAANDKVNITDGTMHSCSEYSYATYDIKVVNISEGRKDDKFAMEFYVYDGERITFTDPDLDFLSYNEIENSLDSVTIEAEALLESKHKLYYNDDGSFRVMVLADLHIQQTSDTTQIEERIKFLVDKEQPNLVIFTGDNIIRTSSEAAARLCIDKMVSYIEEKQIPWCHVYGNHDREGALSNEQQQAIYESYEYCISKDVEELSGVGNYVHGIYNKDGTLGSVIYFFDSGTGNGTYSYDYIQDDQIAWYKETSELLQRYNDGKVVKGMMAFHIPLIENQYAYENRDNVEIVYEYDGERYEAICSSTYDTNLVETILLRGDVEAIVTGHDHNNTYMYNYMGVKLCSAPTISKLGYSKSEAHEGARIFDLNLDTIDNIVTYISYVNEKIEGDYGSIESNSTLESFDGTAPSTGTSGFEGAGLSGSLTLGIAEGKGNDGTNALEVIRSQTSNSEIYIYFNEELYGTIGNNKYLVVWMDFTNVELRKGCTGLLYAGGNVAYATDYDDGTNPPYYFLAEGETEWQTLSHGGDGCFGSADGSSVKGKRGYFAFRIEDYLRSNDKSQITADTILTGFYMYLDIKDSSYANVPFYIDDIVLVEDYTTVE
ncbi:MAG: metallophosphoesterase [Clostridia bacterium]|nr:metallophosphoesterase [Clostridia bacterium]